MAILIIFLGVLLIVIGAVIWKTGSGNFIGRLPGDIRWEGKNTKVYFPLGTSILLSLILTLILFLASRIFR